MRLFKNILFDVDGTLIDTTTANLSALQELLFQDRKTHYPLEELIPYEGIPGRDALKALGFSNNGFDNSLDSALERWICLTKERAHTFQIYYGIVPVLNVLKRAGVKMGVVTSRTAYELHADSLMCRLMPYFISFVTADCTTEHKPSPEPILHALDITGFQAADTLYIGDTRHDYESATGAGITFIKAEWGEKNFVMGNDGRSARTPIDLLAHVDLPSRC